MTDGATTRRTQHCAATCHTLSSQLTADPTYMQRIQLKWSINLSERHKHNVRCIRGNSLFLNFVCVCVVRADFCGNWADAQAHIRGRNLHVPKSMSKAKSQTSLVQISLSHKQPQLISLTWITHMDLPFLLSHYHCPSMSLARKWHTQKPFILSIADTRHNTTFTIIKYNWSLNVFFSPSTRLRLHLRRLLLWPTRSQSMCVALCICVRCFRQNKNEIVIMLFVSAA